MVNRKTAGFSKAAILIIALAISAPAWGSITVCPGGASSSPLTAFTPPPDASTGCSVTNLVYSNFSVGTATGTINGTALVATCISPDSPGNPPCIPGNFQPAAGDIFLTSAAAVGIGLTSPLIRGANGLDCDSNTGPQNVGLAAWCVSGKNQSLVSTVSYQIASATPGDLISQIGLGATVVSHANVTTAVFFREVCLGSAFTNLVGGASGCAGGAANYFVLQVGAVEGNFNTLTQTIGTTFSGVNLVGVRDTAFLQTFNGAGSFAEILYADFTADTPEPATFGLVSLSLVGVGLLRRSRRKPRRS